jgi:hypothetical protein
MRSCVVLDNRLTDSDEVVPQKDLLIFIYVRALINTGAMVRLEGLGIN